MKQEYEIFFSLLNRAVNLNATDIQEARETAHRNCPHLIAPRVVLKSMSSKKDGLANPSLLGDEKVKTSLL
jgi:hypothetical protein